MIRDNSEFIFIYQYFESDFSLHKISDSNNLYSHVYNIKIPNNLANPNFQMPNKHMSALSEKLKSTCVTYHDTVF